MTNKAGNKSEGAKGTRKWSPDGADKAPPDGALDPKKFRSMTPEQKVDTLVGMIAVIKQFGGDPKEFLRDAIRSLSEDQRRALAADPQARRQLQALLDML